jgi:hypothetical protein
MKLFSERPIDVFPSISRKTSGRLPELSICKAGMTELIHVMGIQWCASRNVTVLPIDSTGALPLCWKPGRTNRYNRRNVSLREPRTIFIPPVFDAEMRVFMHLQESV